MIKQLSISEVHAHSLMALGLDSKSLELTSIEAIACSLRRAAGFFCPCAATTLITMVTQALEGLVDDTEDMHESVKNTLEALISSGDLLEYSDIVQVDENKGTLIYNAPPTFVRRDSGAVLLLGIVPDRISPLPEYLESKIEYVSHLRRLVSEDVNDLASRLLQMGFIEVPIEIWLKAPPLETPAQHLKRLGSILDTKTASGEVPGLIILDPTTSVRYYRGRWVKPASQSGRFVARRPQAYGAPLWCYVELEKGLPRKFVDLPMPQGRWRGCDEAWLIQAAIDAERGEPQQFRLREGQLGGKFLEFFSPVPAWARRQWDAFGDPVDRGGCLFAYSFPESEISQEITFAQERLWLAAINDQRRE